MNHWEKQFGASRRRLDRRLLADWERNYGDMPPEAPQKPAGGPTTFLAASTPPKAPTPADDARQAIARAFGRPL